MKKFFLTLFILSTLSFSFNESIAQIIKPKRIVIYTYSRPKWSIGIGPTWNLAANDAYGRANYGSNDQIFRENYGMRWGYGGFLNLKYAAGKLRVSRIYLGFDYKGMKNADFSDENSIKFNIATIGLGYEHVVFGKEQGFRSYFGGGLSGNIISGEFEPKNPAIVNARKFESSFRVGMELKSGLEFVFKNRNRNLGFHLGARYNLMNLFNDDNQTLASRTTEENLNDGDGPGGPGFKRYIGIISIDFGLNIYPDVKRTKWKTF